MRKIESGMLDPPFGDNLFLTKAVNSAIDFRTSSISFRPKATSSLFAAMSFSSLRASFIQRMKHFIGAANQLATFHRNSPNSLYLKISMSPEESPRTT